MTISAASPFADLSGRRAVVTGASSGIGRAIAVELARGRSRVLVHYRKSREGAGQTADDIRTVGGEAELFQADLDQADADQLVDAVWERFGPVDIWINNAGVDLLTGADAALPYSDKLQKLWDVDVAGTVHLSRACARRMNESGGGVILNIGWDQADRGMEGESAELFATAKNAIMGFTRSLALSTAPRVRVNCIAPGWILTAWGAGASDIWQQRVLRETPLQRWGTPEDIARLARFLVSDEAAYITGQVINCNGGAVR